MLHNCKCYMLPCCIPVQWNKLQKLGSWSWSSHWKPCARRQRTRQGTWVIGRSLSSNPKLLGSPSREKQDHMWATLPRLKRNQILAAFPQILIDLFVRMQKLGTHRQVLPERQLVSEGCLVWSLHDPEGSPDGREMGRLTSQLFSGGLEKTSP